MPGCDGDGDGRWCLAEDLNEMVIIFEKTAMAMAMAMVMVLFISFILF